MADYLKETEEIPIIREHLEGQSMGDERESIDSIFGKIEKAIKETKEII